MFVGKQTGEDPKNTYSIICTQQSGAVEPLQQKKIFFFQLAGKDFCPITNTDLVILAMTMKNKNFRADLELFHKKVNKLKEEV